MEKITRRKPLSSRQEPMLAPSDLLGMQFVPGKEYFPGLMSEKYNGVRGTTLKFSHNEPCQWTSRRMEELQMAEHIKHMFQGILDWAEANQVVLDGEFYAPSLNKVGPTMSVIRGTAPVPDDFCFMCFYAIPYSVWNRQGSGPPMAELISYSIPGLRFYKPVLQWTVDSWDHFKEITEETKNRNMEGYMLLDPHARYKHGRCTKGQGILMKFKYYSDPIDARIWSISPMQALQSGPLPRTRNAVGHLKKLHMKSAYEETEIGGSLQVQLEDGKTAKIPFPKGTSHEMRARYLRDFGTGGEWDLKDTYVQFRRLSCEDGDGAIAVREVEFRD